ncbi:DUF1573 domain-containing protein [Flavobacterium sp.]|uniref:DUF1573 domain-containing protein n=1 Tax=Flavobacterium sp. TaxID=239 RepID=UPI0039E238DB
MKKIVLFSLMGTLALTVSCKKTEELSNSDPSSGGADAVLPVPRQQAAAPQQPEEDPGMVTIGATAPMPETKTEKPANGKYAILTFDKKEHNFGTIKQGDVVTYTFKFKNTGGSDLIISNAVGSCGCTVPEYPKTPIKPGESADMKVSFNSAGKFGNQQKTVTVAANTESGKETLTIKANIISK